VSTTAVTFENSYTQTLPELAVTWNSDVAPSPKALIVNEAVAQSFNLDPQFLKTEAGARFLLGNELVDGCTPMALAYAGHQFGGYSPRLGDGRALLLGELINADGQRFDLHLKGSGKTTFSRGGDGKAAIAPMMREHIVSEAMHALGIPTTRSLAIVATGEQIARETWLPGAVLCRIASSHLRVGTFQYAAHHEDPTLVRRLADYAIARHYPHLVDHQDQYLEFFKAVAARQASLISQWMLIGFIHGVMNTDNMTISGETIDYGPCAFMDAFDPTTVFSSIDHNGRYAFGNQPNIGQWNLARLAETLLPLFSDDKDESVAIATEVLMDFPKQYQALWDAGMSKKLGLENAPTDLVNDLLQMLHTQSVDYTQFFRSLSSVINGDASAARNSFVNIEQYDAWESRWKELISRESQPSVDIATSMNLVNPIYIARNHLVEEALAAATEGDLNPTLTLLEVLQQPFNERPGFERFAQPAPSEYKNYQTFCGT
jgi:uncharacterized protein YdiU (UPF0061 family)